MKPESSRLSLPLIIIVLFWAVLSMGLYFWVHKPVTPALAEALGGGVLDIFIAILFASTAGGVGRRALRTVDLSAWSVPERAATHALLGLGVLSLLIVLVGAVALNLVSIALLMIGVSIFTLRDLIAWAGELGMWLRGGLPADRWSRFLVLVALFTIALAFVWALMPPSKWDVLTYHLAGAEQYVEHGRFYAAEHNHFLGFPQLVDTLYAGQLALTGRLAGSALLHWVIGVFVLMMIGGYTARHVNQAAGWLAVVILLSGATIWLEMTFAYNDLLPVGLGVIGLALVESWDGTRRRPEGSTVSWRQGLGYLILLGVIAGFGMSTKYTVIWLAAAFGLLLVWQTRRDGLRTLVAVGAIYTLAASLTLAPWLIRNTIWYGSPTYPMIFEAAEMDSIRQEWYSHPGSGLIYRDDAWQIPLLPVMATIIGVEGAGLYNTDIGPLFLMLIPLLVPAWKVATDEERSTLKRALAVAGFIYPAWLIGAALGSHLSVQTRLVLYMFGPLAVVAGMTFEMLRRLPKKPLDLSFVIQALVAAVLIFTTISNVRRINNSGIHLYFSGSADYEEQYLEHALGWHYVTMRQLDELPAGSTVRFLWEPRYLYCDNVRLNCYTDSLLDSWYYARQTVADGDPAAIAALWRADADYLLVYDYGRRFECGSYCGSGEAGNSLYTEADWRAWDVFVNDHLTEIWRNTPSETGKAYTLYQWRAQAE